MTDANGLPRHPVEHAAEQAVQPVPEPLPESSVVVVGAGIAGISCARVLVAAGLDVVVVDRGRRAGGRMARWTREDRAVDVGAAYFTVRDPDFETVAEDWASRGLAHPWSDTFGIANAADSPVAPDAAGAAGVRPETSGPVRWGAEGGLRSLVEDLATGLDVRLGYEVESVDAIGDDPPRPADATTGGALVNGQPVRAVVLAVPDPQAMDLVSESVSTSAGLDEQWHPVVSVVARFADRTWRSLDGMFVHGSVVSLLVDDGRRRGDGAPVLVAHCTHEASLAHLDAPDALVPQVLDEMRRLLGVEGEPTWVESKRWGAAEPRRARDTTFFLAEANLAICGDGWSPRPRVEAAWLSGRDAGRALAERLR